MPLTRHHVRLERRDRDAVINVCAQCQQAIHGTYPGTALARRPDLWTVEGLLADPLLARTLAYIRKLPPGKTMRMKDRRQR